MCWYVACWHCQHQQHTIGLEPVLLLLHQISGLELQHVIYKSLQNCNSYTTKMLVGSGLGEGTVKTSVLCYTQL